MGMGWNSNGNITNPGLNAVLADSGPLDHAIQVTILLSSSVAATILYEHRNASNDTALESFMFYLTLNQQILIILPKLMVNISSGERVRLVNTTVIVGSAQGTLIIE
jgi:hypothetical protein